MRQTKACHEHGRSTVPGEARWRSRSWGGGRLCCSKSYKAEETLKSTVTNHLGKSCNVCLRAGLPFRS